jgi:hypothetical protein
MVRLSLLVGLALIVLGIGGYVLSNMVSATALIPAAFGVVIGLLGAYGREPTRRRTAMHLAMGVALAGILGSITGVPPFVRWMTGSTPGPLPMAPASKTIMLIVLAIYLGMGIRSFVAARRR